MYLGMYVLLFKSMFYFQMDIYRLRFECVFGAMDIQHWSDFDEKSPPWPSSDAHKFSYVLLNTSDSDVLGLQWKLEEKKYIYSKEASLNVNLSNGNK